MVGIEKFQCPSAREFPEVFKTHLNFIPRAILEGVMAVLNIDAFFLGHPVSEKSMGPQHSEKYKQFVRSAHIHTQI